MGNNRIENEQNIQNVEKAKAISPMTEALFQKVTAAGGGELTSDLLVHAQGVIMIAEQMAQVSGDLDSLNRIARGVSENPDERKARLKREALITVQLPSTQVSESLSQNTIPKGE